MRTKYSATSVRAAETSMRLLKEGKVRDHRLGNSAPIHSGEIEEKEGYIFRDFLPTKTFDLIYNLRGSDIYE